MTTTQDDEIKDKYDLALAVYEVLLPEAPDREAAQDNLLKAGYIIERFIADRERQARQPLWYICTDFVRNGGRVVKGGFETKELAMEYRNVLERVSGKTYAVDTLTNQKPNKEESNE